MALEFESKLIENISEFRRMESEVLLSKFDKAGLLLYLRQRAAGNAKIMIENNAIIGNQLRPMLESLCDAKVADDLFALSQKLYTFNANLDNGLALEVHKGIIAWARACGDTDRLIRSLYSIGFIYQQILSLMVARKNYKFFYQEALEAFEEAASYKEHYFEIENRDTRMYINRCLGNIYVVRNSSRNVEGEGAADQFFSSIDQAIAFWSDARVRSHDPDFPWTAFLGNAHQNICIWEQVLRDQPLDSQSPELVRRVCESFAFLEENSEAININQFWTKARTENSRRFNKYFRKIISHHELIEELRDAFWAAKDDDYSAHGLFEMINVAFQLIDQLEMSTNCSKDEIGAILARVVRYFRNVPSGISRHDTTFSWALASCAKHAGRLLDIDEYLGLLLRFTSYSHLPTYVHTVMVRDLAVILAEYFMQHSPELYIGMCETTDVEDVMSRREEILELISTAALCHDVGKVIYLDTISLHSRRLYDFEFDIIKEHARVDTLLLLQANNDAMVCITDVIMGHHRWFDGSSGYKHQFCNTKSKYRFVIDLVSVSDSIDAATDTVGRSYSFGLTLEQIIEEIKKDAGTRYSSIIADALSDETLVAQMRQCIEQGREDAYYEAYLDIIGQKEEDKK